jgi:hypothetical protein
MLTRDDQGSIPQLVARTGILRTVNAQDARHDIQSQHVLDLTQGSHFTTAYDTAQPAAASPMVQAVAATAVATPPTPVPTPPPAPGMHGISLGSYNGKPVVKFNINAAPPPNDAQGAVLALKRAAGLLASAGHGALPPELVGGPLAALMRGGVAELHFLNGVVVRTAL